MEIQRPLVKPRRNLAYNQMYSVEIENRCLREMKKLDLLDYQEAAQFLGLSEFTVRRYVSKGQLPHVKLGLKLVRVEPAALCRWVEEHRIEAMNNGRD